MPFAGFELDVSLSCPHYHLPRVTMGSLPLHQTLHCKTIDGITLEAWFYAVEGPAPAIIMTHGVSLCNLAFAVLGLIRFQFNCIKEMSLAETAEGFQSAGYNVFLYDSRSIGGSGGYPRNQIDPLQMAEDISGELSNAGT